MSLRFRLEDLSPSQQTQVLKQLSPNFPSKPQSPSPRLHSQSPIISNKSSNTSNTNTINNSSRNSSSSKSKSSSNTSLSSTHTHTSTHAHTLSDDDFNFSDISNRISFSLPPQPINLHDNSMSSTEKRFLKDILQFKAWFEPITLKSPSGNRYTADFLTFIDGTPTLIEVKGNYRLQSEGRAHTAFLEAVSNFSQIFNFMWVKQLKGGKWEQKLVFPRTNPQNPSSSSTSI